MLRLFQRGPFRVSGSPGQPPTRGLFSRNALFASYSHGQNLYFPKVKLIEIYAIRINIGIVVNVNTEAHRGPCAGNSGVVTGLFSISTLILRSVRLILGSMAGFFHTLVSITIIQLFKLFSWGKCFR